MKKKIGVAALLAVLAAGAFAPAAVAQCGTGVLIKFDADCFAYETNYNKTTNISAPGSQLNVVGIPTLFCSPLQDLIANCPPNPGSVKEYTFLWTGLTSLGTVGPTPYGSSGSKWDTDYTAGTFTIYEGPVCNAPHSGSMPLNPPNATVPANFTDGIAILSGTLYNLHVTVTKNSLGTYAGSFRGNYRFYGGSLYNRVAGSGEGLLSGAWCVASQLAGCAPTGYSAHPNGKFDVGTTPALPSTWGTIKQLYR
jgi:hypothetical protein